VGKDIDPRWCPGSCGITYSDQGNNQRDVGYTFHIVPRNFRVAEDVLRGEDEAHLDAKEGRHRLLPHQYLGGLRPVVNSWENASTHRASTIDTK